MNAETPWLREQILVVLIDAGPLSTDQVAQRLPAVAVQRPCTARNPLGCDPRQYESAHVRDFTCRDLVHNYQCVRWGADIYPHLRALEARSQVQRMRLGYDRRVFWTRTDANGIADEIAMLEQMLASS